MKQLIFIRWGEAFDSMEQYYTFLEDFEYNPLEKPESRRWWLAESVKDTHQFICPDMPCKQNATYRAWKIWFEKLFPYLNDNIVVVWYSLGAWFLSKYLAEETFPKTISQLHLIATSLDAGGIEGEWAADFGFDHDLLPRLAEQAQNIFLYHSKDDDIVPFRHLEKLHTALPTAKLNIFEDRGHFFVAEFPELLENITS